VGSVHGVCTWQVTEALGQRPGGISQSSTKHIGIALHRGAHCGLIGQENGPSQWTNLMPSDLELLEEFQDHHFFGVETIGVRRSAILCSV
jgi:hypothetical protein